jgi:hypothetical protein
MEKLPDRAHRDETPMRVAGGGSFFLETISWARDRPVFPDELVGEGKGIPVKLEAARRGGGGNHAWISIGFRLTKGNGA